MSGSGSERVRETCEEEVGDFGDKMALHDGAGLHENVLLSVSRNKGKIMLLLDDIMTKHRLVVEDYIANVGTNFEKEVGGK